MSTWNKFWNWVYGAPPFDAGVLSPVKQQLRTSLDAYVEETMEKERNRGNALLMAKDLIRETAKLKLYITADDIQLLLEDVGFRPADLGNSAGTMFRGIPEVRKLDLTVKSKRKERRGGRIAVYQSRTGIYTGPWQSAEAFAREYNAQ